MPTVGGEANRGLRGRPAVRKIAGVFVEAHPQRRCPPRRDDLAAVTDGETFKNGEKIARAILSQ